MKGKNVEFHCEWCNKKVMGFLILEVKDYVKNITTKEFMCEKCPHRVTRIKSEGTL